MNKTLQATIYIWALQHIVRTMTLSEKFRVLRIGVFYRDYPEPEPLT